MNYVLWFGVESFACGKILVMTSRQYAHPPIQEALCDFQFADSGDWDPTTPGRLHELLSTRYAGKPVERRRAEFEVAVSPEGKPPAVEARDRFDRTQYSSEDGHILVLAGPGVLSANTVAPYDGWDNVRPRIVEAYEAFRKVGEWGGVRRIGVRYINQIVTPEPVEHPSTLVNWPIPAGDGIPDVVHSFINRVDYRFDDETKLLLTFGELSVPGHEGSAFLLDLDTIWESDQPLENDHDVFGKVDHLRSLERVAFESLITDAARDLFDGS